MRITMKTLYATPDFTAQPGDTLNVSGDLGKQLIDRRFAVLASADPARTAAAADDPEPDEAPVDDEPDEPDEAPPDQPTAKTGKKTKKGK